MSTGAEKLLEVLVDGGVEVCFANPGTSEMHLVAAIGATDSMRPVLCLFEGVVSGAADGYARMADKPAATLLHVGSGFSNAMANLHNAKRAGVPLVNIVGDHASYHQQYDAPLTSDVPAHAKICSASVRVSESPDDLALAGAEAIRAARQSGGQIATLIVPADHAWNEASAAVPVLPAQPLKAVSAKVIRGVAAMLSNGKPTALILGGRALRDEGLKAAGRIAEKTGAALLCETFPTRLQRGAGRVAVQRIPYFAEQAAELLDAFEQVVLIGAKAPVSFFAYPGKASQLLADGCETRTLASTDQDMSAAMEALAVKLNAPTRAAVGAARHNSPPPGGPLTPLAIGETLSSLLPEDAIVSDEGATCGMAIYAVTEYAASHDWLTLTGGAIGQGLPLSLGCAIACPERKVVALQADGSAMYTIQALWTMARENVDVTVVLLNNRSYAILNIELARVGAGVPNDKTLSMFDLSNPDMSFADMANGMGVRATCARTAEEFHVQFADAMTSRGPRLIEALIVQRPG